MDTNWKIGKIFLRYVNGTNGYRKNIMIGLEYIRMCFHLGLGSISWESKKQPIVSLSIAEDKYILINATKF